MRDGWDISGAIGQEVYGAGMAPAMAALALVEIAPGLVVYSGYPPVAVAGEMVTFAGTAGSNTPVIVVGADTIRMLQETQWTLKRAGLPSVSWPKAVALTGCDRREHLTGR